MILSVLKLSSGDFVVGKHEESEETSATVKFHNPFLVEWRFDKEGTPHVLMMKWGVGVNHEIVSIMKSSIVAIFAPSEHMQEQYIEALEKIKLMEQMRNARENIEDGDEVSLPEALRKIFERLQQDSLREDEDLEDEESTKFITPGNDTIH